MKQRLFDIIAHGPHMQSDAFAATRDVNAAYFLVHGVVADALNDRHKPAHAGALNQSMHESLRDWRAEADRLRKRA